MSSVRHTPRQAERDLRLHEPHAVHAHPALAQQQPPPPPPQAQHINGNGHVSAAPAPSAASVPPTNGGPHGHPLPSHISPKAPPPASANVPESIQKLVSANEQTWLVIGSVAEQMGDLDHALSAYENALRHNAYSIAGLTQVAGIARIKENFQMAVEYFQRVLNLQPENGEIWSALGHCYLMQDDLQKAYQAYQHALYSLPNPKENPKLWYGIGILYDRYGSLENAEEAFSSVLKMDKDFDKSNEVLFRLGIIYKQQTKYEESLRCFERILRSPPSPLANADIFFQIGHVYEQQGNFSHARDAYERVVHENPSHAKVLQQLGWLYHQDGTNFQNQELAIQYLTKSLESDPTDAQSWYLLGRAFMAGQKYNKAYEAYQQAVYRDGRNPTFWCSIGVLYFQINQYRDALDAYSRAIRINPYIPEVWYDLGSLYESCNNQIGDAIDAYARAAELDPNNPSIKNRLAVLKHSQATGAQIPAAPQPQDVHPTQYANTAPPPHGLGGPLILQTANGRPSGFRADSRGPDPGMPPPSASAVNRSPPPFRPAPVVIDESRQPVGQHPHLAPMEVDNVPPPPSATRESGPGGYPPPLPREHSSSGRNLSLLLHHDEPPRATPAHPHEAYYSRGRAPSTSDSPRSAHPGRPRSPATSPYQHYQPTGRPPVGPGQIAPHQRSPHTYPREPPPPAERDAELRRREWEREHERRAGPGTEYSVQQSGYYRGGSPPPQVHRRSPRPVPLHDRTSPQTSPASAHAGPRGAAWDSRYAPPPPHSVPPVSPRIPGEHPGSRPESVHGDRDAHRRVYDAPPEGYPPQMSRNAPPPPPPAFQQHRASESPHSAQRGLPMDRQPGRRRGTIKDEPPVLSGPGSVPPAPPPLPHSSSSQTIAEAESKRDRKSRRPNGRRKDDMRSQTETPKPYPPQGQQQFRGRHGDSPEPGSSNGSNRSVQPSPTTATPAPNRVVDEDYDEGVTDALISLSQYRAPENTTGPGYPGPMSGPAMPPVPRQASPTPSMRSHHSHRGSISSTRSHNSPPAAGVKRTRSPAPMEDVESKRSRMEPPRRRASSPAPQGHSTRPSPLPFITQPSSVSGETHSGPAGVRSYPPSPPLPAVLPPPPHPRSAASHAQPLPPIATLSPASTAASPVEGSAGDNRTRGSNSPRGSPSSRGKLADVMNPTTGSKPPSQSVRGVRPPSRDGSAGEKMEQ